MRGRVGHLERLFRREALQRVVKLLHHRVAHHEQRLAAQQRRQLAQARLRQPTRVHVRLAQPRLRRPPARRLGAGRAVLGHDVLELTGDTVTSHAAAPPVDPRLEGEVHPRRLAHSKPRRALERLACAAGGTGSWKAGPRSRVLRSRPLRSPVVNAHSGRPAPVIAARPPHVGGACGQHVEAGEQQDGAKEHEYNYRVALV
mmetsp:Transcript_16159/g.51061  ORF Transcript_16159/g.51061 Transcript_16159/m.51061 type:complete len:201 (-) Transcript_16159:93-695(-)